eukprot:XP_020407754.1 uncharacterized protein LOC109945810 [Zea mays]
MGMRAGGGYHAGQGTGYARAGLRREGRGLCGGGAASRREGRGPPGQVSHPVLEGKSKANYRYGALTHCLSHSHYLSAATRRRPPSPAVAPLEPPAVEPPAVVPAVAPPPAVEPPAVETPAVAPAASTAARCRARGEHRRPLALAAPTAPTAVAPAAPTAVVARPWRPPPPSSRRRPPSCFEIQI